ncbi:hypothetical protein [Flavobacterium sp.]|uniref:hypothetical protein n=1 Tax=Flavobacterium sp. TaxID=239 RepID=UPI0025EF0862|nr:hypothetical protein [Flavobacterium sp.]
MTKYSKIALCALVIGALSLTSCSKDSSAAPASIYQRLGGTTMVADPDNPGQMIESGRLSYRKVVKTTIGLIVADITSNPPASGNLGAHFAPLLSETGTTQATNLAELTDNLTDFFSFNTGGTNAVNTYSGLSMAAAHNPATNPRMGVKANAANYTKFEGYVGAAAVQNGVAANTQLYTDIVAVLESLRPTIVQQ